MINFSEYNRKFNEHINISLNMKIFSNTRKFTEYKTSFECENVSSKYNQISSEYENVSVNIINFPLNMKMFLLNIMNFPLSIFLSI